MGVFKDALLDIGVEIIKNRYKDFKLRKAMEDRLEQYLDRQQKLNRVCTVDEEIDFQALAEYIRSELIEDAELRFFGSTDERRTARDTILSKTKQYARANTSLAESRAVKMVDTSLNILRVFFRKNVPWEQRFMAAEIVDEVNGHTDEALENVSGQLDDLSEKIDGLCVGSVDANVRLAKEGKLDQVRENMLAIQQSITPQHPLFPDYGYAFSDGHMYSKPLTADAKEKYPSKFHIKFDHVTFGDEQHERINAQTIQRAIRLQRDIVLNGVVVEKWLGSKLDPIQDEAKAITGTDLVIKPAPFPPAQPYSISIGGTTYFDYVLLRTKEILDNGNIVLTNEEQENRSFDIRFILNPDMRDFTTQFKPRTKNNSDILKNLLLMKAVKSGQELTVKSLSQGELLFAVKMQSTDSEPDEEDIELMKKVVAVEEYLGKPLELPDELSLVDCMWLDYVYDLVSGKGHTEKCSKFSASFTLSGKIENTDKFTDGAVFSVEFKAQIPVNDFFGQSFELPIKRRIDGAKLKNVDKAKKLAEILDGGDNLKLDFVPADGYDAIQCIDTLQHEAESEHQH